MNDRYTHDWFGGDMMHSSAIHRNPSFPAMVHPALGHDSTLDGLNQTHQEVGASSNSVLIQELPSFPLPVTGFIQDNSTMMVPLVTPINALHIPGNGMLNSADMHLELSPGMESTGFTMSSRRKPSRKTSRGQLDSLSIATNILGKHQLNDSNGSSQNDLYMSGNSPTDSVSGGLKSPKKRHRNGESARLNRKKKQENFELVQAQTGKMVEACDHLLRTARRLEDEIAHWRTVVQQQQQKVKA